ncbi:MAG: hypothetical protein KAR20_15265, partial [Candidatus Heimdallarchaeota archaeon]|nr:hypothetical protein [Candidatus Heimdallarchaeota archaeon]
PQILVMDASKSVDAQFLLNDTVPPEITNVDAQPNPQTQGGFVNITCDVTDDNSGVAIVKVNIVDPYSGVSNVSMTARGGYYYNAMYSIDGDYSYYIWAEDSAGNGNKSATQQFTIEEPEGGWQLISEPVSSSIPLSSLTVIYNSTSYTWTDAVSAGIVDPNVFGWSGTLQTYTIASTIDPGQGYWLYAYRDGVEVKTTPTGTPGNITDLCENWNLIGLPFNQTVALSAITVEHNSTDYTWAEATNLTNNIVDPNVFGWTGDTYGIVSSIEPFKGYWVYAYKECTLKI